MSTQLTPEQKANRIKNITKFIALGIICVFIAPFTILALKGLIGIIAFFTLAVPVYYFLPFMGTMLANWRLKAYIAMANANPTITLKRILSEKESLLAQASDKIGITVGEYNTFCSKLEDFKHKHPELKDEIAKNISMAAEMRQLIDLRKKNWQKSKASIEDFKVEMDRLEAMWEMSQAAIAAKRAMGTSEDEILREIQKKTAIDAVTRNMNVALADLETSLMEEGPVTVAETSKELITSSDLQPESKRQKIAV